MNSKTCKRICCQLAHTVTLPVANWNLGSHLGTSFQRGSSVPGTCLWWMGRGEQSSLQEVPFLCIIWTYNNEVLTTLLPFTCLNLSRNNLGHNCWILINTCSKYSVVELLKKLLASVTKSAESFRADSDLAAHIFLCMGTKINLSKKNSA